MTILREIFKPGSSPIGTRLLKAFADAPRNKLPPPDDDADEFTQRSALTSGRSLMIADHPGIENSKSLSLSESHDESANRTTKTKKSKRKRKR
jgi:hypothetical protein